jgi:hypothetical protein
MTAGVLRREAWSRFTSMTTRLATGALTLAMIFSADETTDVGRETGSVVTSDYGVTGNAFTGEMNWIRIDTGEDSHDHLISTQDRYRVAMAKQ